MSKYWIIIFLNIILNGCVSWNDKPNFCFHEQPAIRPASAGELRAVRFVERREAANCRTTNIECDLQLSHQNNGQIEVSVFTAFIEGDPSVCVRLDGGFKTYVFSAEGRYIRIELGL